MARRSCRRLFSCRHTLFKGKKQVNFPFFGPKRQKTRQKDQDSRELRKNTCFAGEQEPNRWGNGSITGVVWRKQELIGTSRNRLRRRLRVAENAWLTRGQ